MTSLTKTRSAGPIRRAMSRFLDNGAAVTGAGILIPILLFTLTYDLWWPYKPNDIDLLAMNQGPSSAHWLGSDGVGRDIMARLMQGADLAARGHSVNGDFLIHRVLHRRRRRLGRAPGRQCYDAVRGPCHDLAADHFPPSACLDRR